ncbi:hypothetical protein HYS79_01305 [Patescibacteria group bacterium]|nr:hypothetical protein [Patescibacteria group bacterium]
MEHIRAHIKAITSKKERATERGELMQYFLQALNRSRARDGILPLTMPRMGRVLQAIPTKDLYYLKSVCDQASNFSKKFWWEINPKKHTLGRSPTGETPQPAPPAPPKKKALKRAPRTRG